MPSWNFFNHFFYACKIQIWQCLQS
jgi:hypothetical protein